MALIHILDKQTDEIIGTLNVGKYTDAVRRSSLDNKNQFDFIALKHFDKLEKRNRLLVQDADGFFHEYIITFAEQRDRYQKHIMADASFVDLAKAKVIPPTTLQGATPYTAAEYALSDTEWQVGEVEYTGTRTITIEEYTNPYDLLKQIASEFGLEIRFRVEVSGNRITGRYVDMKQQIAGFEGKEIEFGKDLIGITRKEDNSRIVTALLGVGPKREDGTRLTYLAVDTDALQRWGRNGKHLIEVYEVESSDVNMTLETLKSLTETELQKRIDAIVSYECTAAAIEHIDGLKHEKIRLGQTVRIKDEGYSPPLFLEARIQEVEEDPSTRQVLSFKLGNFIEYKKEDLEAQIKLLKELMKQKASSADVQQALEYAEQKAQEAETNAKQYADAQDVTVYADATYYADQVANTVEQNAKTFTQQNALIKDQMYNGLKWSDTDGLIVERSDGKVRSLLNGIDGIKVQVKDDNSNWIDMFFVDTDGNVQFAGNLQGATGTFTGTLSVLESDANWDNKTIIYGNIYNEGKSKTIDNTYYFLVQNGGVSLGMRKTSTGEELNRIDIYSDQIILNKKGVPSVYFSNNNGNLNIQTDMIQIGTGAAAIDVKNNAARLKYNDLNYYYVTAGFASVYLDGAIRFRFDRNAEHNRIASGAAILKFLSSSAQIQSRTADDTAYGIFGAADFVVSSTRDTKTNIEPTVYGLDTILNTPVYDYKLKYEVETFGEENARTKTGLIWEEAPENLRGEGTLDLYSMVGIAWRAIQELAKEVNNIKASLGM